MNNNETVFTNESIFIAFMASVFKEFIFEIDLSMFAYVLHDKYMHKRIKIIQTYQCSKSALCVVIILITLNFKVHICCILIHKAQSTTWS